MDIDTMFYKPLGANKQAVLDAVNVLIRDKEGLSRLNTVSERFFSKRLLIQVVYNAFKKFPKPEAGATFVPAQRAIHLEKVKLVKWVEELRLLNYIVPSEDISIGTVVGDFLRIPAKS